MQNTRGTQCFHFSRDFFDTVSKFPKVSFYIFHIFLFFSCNISFFSEILKYILSSLQNYIYIYILSLRHFLLLWIYFGVSAGASGRAFANLSSKMLLLRPVIMATLLWCFWVRLNFIVYPCEQVDIYSLCVPFKYFSLTHFSSQMVFFFVLIPFFPLHLMVCFSISFLFHWLFLFFYRFLFFLSIYCFLHFLLLLSLFFILSSNSSYSFSFFLILNGFRTLSFNIFPPFLIYLHSPFHLSLSLLFNIYLQFGRSFFSSHLSLNFIGF